MALCNMNLEDRDHVLEVVSSNGFALQHAPAELKSDRQVVSHAVQEDGLALAFAADILKKD
eukprot:2401940-Amphidinium_carterae.1